MKWNKRVDKRLDEISYDIKYLFCPHCEVQTNQIRINMGEYGERYRCMGCLEINIHGNPTAIIPEAFIKGLDKNGAKES